MMYKWQADGDNGADEDESDKSKSEVNDEDDDDESGEVCSLWVYEFMFSFLLLFMIA